MVERSDNVATNFLAADACAIAKLPIVEREREREREREFSQGDRETGRQRPCFRFYLDPHGRSQNCSAILLAELSLPFDLRGGSAEALASLPAAQLACS